jgi:RNA polymerase sigma factor (sigma-70 family)
MKATYNKSMIMKRAWKLFKAQEIRTMEMWSTSLKESWNIAKNGVKSFDIETLYTKYYQLVYHFILGKVNHVEDAEEIANDVFIKAHKNRANYDVHTAKINTWLFAIAKNAVIDFYRTNHTDQYVNVSNFADAETGKEVYQFIDDSADVVENNELAEQIRLAFVGLKPKYRKVADLFFLHQKQYKEIAEILDIPMGTVFGMISRCRAMLQKSLVAVR